MLILSWILFISFSLGCALSKNMTTLYVTPHPSHCSNVRIS